MAEIDRSHAPQLIWQSAVGILVVGFFVVWGLRHPESLSVWSAEDGPLENLTAVCFGLAAIGFVAIAVRSKFLRTRAEPWRYFMTLAWALLMFVFMGEEISWGQRLFGFGVPESISSVNYQNELNVHNLELLRAVPGGGYRMISLFMILTGFVFPLLALSNWGRSTVQRLAFPVAPIGYAVLFVGAYLFGRYYSPVDLITASEVRELVMAIGMFSFALHGALCPWVVFRMRRDSAYGRLNDR